jgi:carbamoyltransferase
MRTEMDVLVIGSHILFKEDQPPLAEGDEWKKEFPLD